MKIAIVDLGSNTFHLLIASYNSEGLFDEVFRERAFVGLSEGGVDTILPMKIELGLETCKRFKEHIELHEVDRIKVVGTAVLRKAQNRMDFIKPCEAIFETNIEIIAGSREAELIYKGVSLLGLPMKSAVLMDIGGGSVEYILVKEGEMVWCQSFPLGVGILHAEFHHSEPIAVNEIENVKSYIKKLLAPLQEQIEGVNITDFIGASGSFEVVKDVYDYDHKDKVFTVEIKDLKELSKRIIASNYEERVAIKGIPEQRVKLIVVAMLLIEVTMEMVMPDKLIVSPFAIKEGLLSEMLKNG